MTVSLAEAAYHHPTPLDTQFEPMTLPAMLERTLRKNPEAPFLHFLGRTYSYAQIHQQAQAFARGLAALGIARVTASACSCPTCRSTPPPITAR